MLKNSFLFDFNVILTFKLLHDLDLINNSNFNVYIFNKVINKYSIFIRKKCPEYKTLCVYYSQEGAREPKITLTFTRLINTGTKNVIMQNKSRMWRNSYFWLIETSYIHVANPYSLWLLMFYTANLVLHYKKPIYSSSIGSAC